MHIALVMTPNPVTVGPEASLATVKSLMDAGKFRRVVIVEKDMPIGILTERDLREHTGYLESTRVTAAMRSPLIAIAPDRTAEDAARLMIAHKIGGLPVLQGDRLIGIVTSTDLLKAFLRMAAAAEQILSE